MYKGITLNQFIDELQKLAETRGNDELRSIGACSGKIFGLTSPYCLNFVGDRTEYIPAFVEDVKPLVQTQVAPVQVVEGGLRHVWARVGMTLDITPEEEKAIFEGEYLDGKAAVKRAVMDGRAALDGETYIPEDCIADYDREYDTNYWGGPKERAWSLDGDRVNQKEFAPPCKVGDVIFEICVDSQGMSHINEADVLEVSTQRIWVDSNYYDYDDIGRSVFLSLADAEAALASPECLAARVSAVMRYNISDDSKKGLLIAGFAVGQEYFEKADGRSLRFIEKLENDFWKFDVFDRNGQWMHSTNAFAPRLALDILNGEIVPAAMARDKSVDGLIAEASDKSMESNKDCMVKFDVDFEKE